MQQISDMRRFCLFILILLSLGTLRAHKPTDTLSAGRWEFVQNLGQWEAPVLYKATIHGGALFFERNSFVVTQLDPNQLAAFHEAKHSGTPYPSSFLDAAAYRVTFLNALNETKVSGIQPFDYYYNYYIGQDSRKWASHVSIYHHLTYNQLYPGIDLYFLGNNDYLKYEFHVAAGGDPKQIQLRYDGLKSISKAGEELLLHTAVDRVLELAPFAYQINEKGDTIPVDCSYALSKNIVSFSLGQYDSALPLVIDPTVVFSSYSGSTADNWGYTATYDSYGNLYGGGIVDGIGYPTFPTSPTSTAYQTSFSGQWDIAISKFDSSGRFLHYSTYLGGSNYDIPHSMYVNDNDELYIFGTTGSADFPVTANAFDATFNGGSPISIPAGTLSYGSDIFIAKLSADGTQLPASTYIGGSGNDGLNTAIGLRKNYADEHRGEIIVDENSNVYVVASTNSTDFPTTTNGYISNPLGGQDACVFKMSQDLSSLIWSTYYGGSGNDAGYSMFVTTDKSVYFCGGTTSNDLPITPNAYQTEHADNGTVADGYIAHLSSNGNLLLNSTYLGKSGYDQSYLIQGDKNDIPHALGQTSANDRQWVFNAAYFVPNGGQFLIKLSSDLTTPIWSTAFGTGNGGPDISPTALLVDYCDNIYISGWGGRLNQFGGTNGLPFTDNAFQRTTDDNDFYFMAISNDANNLEYATYFGAPDNNEHVDGGTSRFDKHGKIYQAVCAGCGGQSSFPTIPPNNVYSNTNGSTNCNLGVIKIDFSMPIVVADFLMPNVVCLPDVVTFQNLSHLFSDPTSSSTSILWDFGDGTTSSDWEPQHLYSQPGYYEVTLTIRDLSSCNTEDTLKKRILVLSNTSSTLPTVSICNGDYAELGVPPSIGVNYQWSPSGTLNNPTISNPIATPTVTTLYTLTASTAACVDIIYQTVEVHDLSASISGDTMICFGESTTLSVNVTTTDSYTIEWSETVDFLNIITTNTPTITVTPTYSRTYYVRVTTDFCVKIIPCHISVFNIKIIGKPNYLLCFDPDLTLQTDCSGGTLPYQYQWQLDDGENSTSPQPTFTPQQSTNYTVTVTDALGCTATVSGRITVRTGTFPEPLQAWCSKYEIFAYHETTLFSTDYGNDYIYQWTPSQEMSTPNLPSTTVFPNTTTTYTVSVTDTFGCTLTDTVNVKVNPVDCDMPFVFIPNSFTPNGDGVNDILYVRSGILDECYFVVYNRWGEKVFQTYDNTIGWDGTFKKKECQRGVYDYYFKGKCKDGDELEMKGNVTLIR